MNAKRLLWHLLGATRGGPLRIRLLAILQERPSNANQLALALGVDYKTVQHHLRVLRENRLAEPGGDGYGATWFLGPLVQGELAEFDRIRLQMKPVPVANVEPSASASPANAPIESITSTTTDLET
ncbi:MAG: winged helix-turn-helix domain-containing protein [Candidatus Thermoplasmatota archaeon]